jgi:hypothetical protein
MTTELKIYHVTLHVEQTINAEDEEEALAIFWDDLHENQAGGAELAIVEGIR